MEHFDIDVAVVGAGVVGLAVARALALAGREVVLLEAARTIGSGISSRNSEVIHAGIYYPRDSLKARLCVDGRARLYDYCGRRDVPHRRCGKIIVASDAAELPQLEHLLATGLGNGVADLTLLGGRQTAALEPAVRAVGALLSPSTGIVDSHALMQALRADLEAAGGTIAFQTPVLRAEVDRSLVLWTGGREPSRIAARALVNAAGLFAPRLLRAFVGFPEACLAPCHFAKGSYFAFAGPSPFRRLVYPLPEPGGIGIHATLDLAGNLRFGPDVEWIDSGDDFAVDATRAARFETAIRRYWPALPDGALRPDYAGIRPKLTARGAAAADFWMQDEAVHGIAGLVNLLGIESPGLTASLAIAALVAEKLAA